MVELLKCKTMMLVIVLVLGVSFIGSGNDTTLEDEQPKIQINA